MHVPIAREKEMARNSDTIAMSRLTSDNLRAPRDIGTTNRRRHRSSAVGPGGKTNRNLAEGRGLGRSPVSRSS